MWQGARQSIPGDKCQNGLCDSSIVRTSTGTTIYIQQDLSPFDFLKMVLHEVGHYQGLGDVYDPTANGRTVMADNVLLSQRLAYVTACDQVKSAEYNREIWANIPPGGGQCPPGGCQDYGLPCGIGGGAPRDGWCYPPGGGGGVVTDWWWYFLLKSNDLPLSAVTSTGTLPATGAVTIATHDYDGRVVRVDWYANDGYVGTSNGNPYSLPYANAAPGTYKLQANVWDQRLGTAWSAPVWVTITPGGGGGGGGTVALPNHLALWSHTTGQYVFAQGDLLVATNGQVQTLTAQSLGGGYYALRAPYNGYYVAAEGGGGGWVHVNRDTVREWETFRAVGLGGNVVAFQTYNGRYLNVDPATGIIFATATTTETATRFSFTALP